MSQPYLEVTYRRGQAFAAYYHLCGRAGQKSHRTRRVEPGLVVDFARDGTVLGIEITDPSAVTAAGLNRLLKEFGFPPVKRADLEPLRTGA